MVNSLKIKKNAVSVGYYNITKFKEDFTMRKQKSLILLLIFAMALSLFPQSAFAAKKKVKLNKKR